MAANSTCDFSVMSLNVRGLNCFKKRKSVFRWLQRKNNSLVFLQETHSTAETAHIWARDWKGKIIYSHGSSNSKGCMILVKEGFDLEITLKKCDNKGRFVLLKGQVQGEPITLLNVYAPNTENEQVEFFKDLDHVLHSNNISNNDEIVIGGDWNLVRDFNLDKCGGMNNPKLKSIDKLNNFISNYELNDVWRIKNLNAKRYSWRQPNPLIQCRLDYWLISDTLYNTATHIDIIPSVRSDHSAITIKFQSIQNTTRGPTFWKFNNSLLENNDFVSKMKNNINQWKLEYNNDDKRVEWELLKYKIRKFIVKFSKNEKSVKKDKELELEKKLIILERNLKTQKDQTDYDETKKQLQNIEDEKTKGCIVRSRVKWHEEGEKSTKFFFELEKQNAVRKNIRKLRCNNGTVTTDQKIISKMQINFFEKLYSSKPVNETLLNSFQAFSLLIKLDMNYRESCEGLITADECLKVINKLSKNKSPGNDGLTAEFYVHFWSELKDSLLICLNYSHYKQELSTSQKQAVITLINKKDKDRLHLANWRPISLLNVDFKIASKVIASRLHNIIPKLVDISQTGFVKDRLIGDSIRVINDLMDICKLKKQNMTLMMIDFEKAFDTLNWNFLFKTLQSMNFGPSLINWVKTFYTNIESCVMNNGSTSGYFKIKRGVRQGDPLSSYLFVLAVETLSVAVKNDNGIHGFKLKDTEIKLVQYADDTTAILKDLKSVNNFLTLTNTFEHVSGLKINKEKTEAIWLGPGKPLFALPQKIKWSTKPIKILGIYFSCDYEEMIEINYSKKIKAIQKMIYMWKQRDLSLTGKVLIIKALAMSQILYLANLLPFPDDKIKQVEDILYEFIWNGKIHKVKKKIFIQSYEDGGYKMPDIRSIIQAQKLKWVKLYLNNHACLWRITMEELIDVENLNILLRSNFCIKDYSNTSDFYKEILKSLYYAIQPGNANPNHEIYNQFLYYNRNIKINDKCFFNRDLFNIGLWRVHDLYDKQNNLIPFETLQKRGASMKSYMIWRTLVSIIKEYMNDLHDSNTPNAGVNILDFNDQPHNLLIIDSKTVTKCLTSRLMVESKVKKKITERYHLTQEAWLCIYLLPQLTVKNNKIKDFQYMILHSFLPTNDLLFKMNKIPSYLCSFCNMYKESIAHMFYECFLFTTCGLSYLIKMILYVCLALN